MRRKKMFLNIGSGLLLQMVILISGFIVPRLIIKNFGSDVNGLVASITQFLGYITLLESGIGPVIKAALYKPISEKNKDEIVDILKEADRFFKKISLIYIVYILVLCFTYPLLVDSNFDNFFTISLILIISISSFAEYFFGITYRIYLQAEQKVYISSLIQIVSYILNIIFVVVLVKLNCNIQIVKLFSALSFALRPIFQNLYVKKKYGINLKNSTGRYKLKNKWHGLSQHIAYVIHNNTDVILLTFFAPIAEVSVYSVYSFVVHGVKAILQSFTSGLDALFGNMLAKKEKSNLIKKFTLYEFIYSNIVTIVYACTFILIVPFIKVYTSDIVDANYIRPFFGFLMVLGWYIWSMRVPYNLLIQSAGHFKETQVGAWIEASVNVVCSIILINFYGIAGVAIGTVLAMLIRTINFIHHSNKHILDRKQIVSIRFYLINLFEVFLVILIFNKFNFIEVSSYFNWFFYAMIVFAVAFIIVVICNIVLNYNMTKETVEYICIVLKSRKKK